MPTETFCLSLPHVSPTSLSRCNVSISVASHSSLDGAVPSIRPAYHRGPTATTYSPRDRRSVTTRMPHVTAPKRSVPSPTAHVGAAPHRIATSVLIFGSGRARNLVSQRKTNVAREPRTTRYLLQMQQQHLQLFRRLSRLFRESRAFLLLSPLLSARDRFAAGC